MEAERPVRRLPLSQTSAGEDLGQSSSRESPERWSEHGHVFRVDLSVFSEIACGKSRKGGSQGQCPDHYFYCISVSPLNRVT